MLSPKCSARWARTFSFAIEGSSGADGKGGGVSCEVFFLSRGAAGVVVLGVNVRVVERC